MSNRTTKDVANAYRAMGRKMFQKRKEAYDMKPRKKRGLSYKELWQQADTDLSFEDWLREIGITL